MKVFVLAGGLGTRLKPRFGELPKGLAPLGGRPFLERQIRLLADAGARAFVMCAGYGADAMREALGDGASLGVSIAWSIEPEPLGTAGALRLAAAHVDGPALVVNGDTIAPCDPFALERTRWEHGAFGAIALYRVEDAASRGTVEWGTDGEVVRFVEKGMRGPAWVNGGVYTFSPQLWRELERHPQGPLSLERDVLPPLAERHALRALAIEGEFWDIGTPEEWERAERRFGT